MSRRRKRNELIPEIAEPSRGVPRRVRVEREVKEHLITAFGALRDPRLSAVMVTRVSLTDDLRLARVYVRLIVDIPGDTDRRDLMRALRAASGRLRHALAELELRFTPELRFHYDEGEDAARRVDELLAEIRASTSNEEP
ncbi:MAG TPA: 30S ribosome-binding factor RbfA [Polyangiaceae bacterium]|nr:30S ribosome-binding factor RbfA [Polyangiaceae bacterium]